MDNSDQQFDELLSHLIPRVNDNLAAGTSIRPVGIVLREDKTVEVMLGAAETKLTQQTVVQAIRASLVERVARGKALASCIAFPHQENSLIVMLENHENYAATMRIPVLSGEVRTLDVNNMQVDDGAIHVFPVIDEE